MDIEDAVLSKAGEGKKKIGEDCATGVSPSKKKPSLGIIPCSSTTIEDNGNMRMPERIFQESKEECVKLDEVLKDVDQENPTRKTTRGTDSEKKNAGSLERKDVKTQMDSDLDSLHTALTSPFT